MFALLQLLYIHFFYLIQRLRIFCFHFRSFCNGPHNRRYRCRNKNRFFFFLWCRLFRHYYRNSFFGHILLIPFFSLLSYFCYRFYLFYFPGFLIYIFCKKICSLFSLFYYFTYRFYFFYFPGFLIYFFYINSCSFLFMHQLFLLPCLFFIKPVIRLFLYYGCIIFQFRYFAGIAPCRTLTFNPYKIVGFQSKLEKLFL